MKQNNGKWVARYIFMGLLLLLAVGWCVYCWLTIRALQEQVNTTAFIDAALNDVDGAQALLARVDRFQALMKGGIAAGIVVLAATALLITFHVLFRKGILPLKLQPRAPKAAPIPPAPVQAPTPAQTPDPAPASAPFRCPSCGALYGEKPRFCGKCGMKIE